MVLQPMAVDGKDAVWSMGDDTPIAALARSPRPIYNYLRQRFAQVTNPPIDHLRERLVMSLRTLLGARVPILTEGPEAARLTELESFLLFPSAVETLATTPVDATFSRSEGLKAACERIASEAEAAVRDGAELLLVRDTELGADRAPIPALLAVGAVHQHLVKTGLRTRASLVVLSDEPRETHHFATLLGFGADAICPRLALESMAVLAETDKLGGDRPDAHEAQLRFKTAIEDGLLKIMSKMGISDVASYRGAQLFEAIGLAQEVVEVAFARTPSPFGGVGFAELEEDAWARVDAAQAEKPALENPGYVKWRKGGEEHATSVPVVSALHETVEMKAAHELRRAVQGESWERYERFSELVNSRVPIELRDLLELVPAGEAVPLEEVEPVDAIVKRFSSGAMSHGALSKEAHETIAIALNRLGARSNCGEGGEAPDRYASDRNSFIKQVASGRFGVTPAYLRSAGELQIKVAQGSKPGEGGQLPGHKVTVEIAKLRHTEPGVALISPPPHHDIYSIEDLAQLIFDLRQANPRADVSVKLVAGSGVGIIAAGVIKALADIVHIAGCDGGTGASPLSSIKNAGAPWEMGLAETQQALVSEGLRSRARVRVDGGFKTGRDVVVAALLGADEYSFGTALLLAEGCLMVRSCHLDTCPVGIATQNPELRKKFVATPEQVEAYLLFVAEEVRRTLASLGLRSLDEAIGRTELLRQRAVESARANLLDVSPLLAKGGDGPLRYMGDAPLEAPGGSLNARLALEGADALEQSGTIELAYPIRTGDRTVGARLGGDIGERFALERPPGKVHARFTGAAGQSFGAFLAKGVTLELEGVANDYVGKGMGGGRIVIKPPANDAGEPVLVGNTVLYGATGGSLYVAGRAGERFGVRNSGATAVVEGTGDHPVEYMTSGTVVILGPHGRNLGAGMSGGEVFVYDPDDLLRLRFNPDLVAAERLDENQALRLRGHVGRHEEFTGSQVAHDLLDRWDEVVDQFWRIAPKANVARLEEEHEGTVTAP
jgi:glutamate synthase (ferredoxin)